MTPTHTQSQSHARAVYVYNPPPTTGVNPSQEDLHGSRNRTARYAVSRSLSIHPSYNQSGREQSIPAHSRNGKSATSQPPHIHIVHKPEQRIETRPTDGETDIHDSSGFGSGMLRKKQKAKDVKSVSRNGRTVPVAISYCIACVLGRRDAQLSSAQPSRAQAKRVPQGQNL